MQQINQISFTGSRTLLNDADWVCRKVKTAFPIISPTQIYYSNPEIIRKNRRFVSFLHEKSLVLQEDRLDRRLLKSPFKFLKEVLYSATSHRVGNCFEQASLAEMIARMNGVKNCYKLTMEDLNTSKSLDHTVLLVTKNPLNSAIINSKESIIIDPWLGISGRAEAVLERYKNQFGKMFGLNNKTLIAFKMKKRLELNENEIEILKAKFPNLVFDNKGRKTGFMKFA